MMPPNLTPLDPDYHDHIWRVWRARELKIELYEETLRQISKQSLEDWAIITAMNALGRGRVLDGPATERSRRESWISKSIEMIVKAVRDGFESDPGTSDLDDEQPVHVRVELGVWRRAGMVAREMGVGVGLTSTKGGAA